MIHDSHHAHEMRNQAAGIGYSEALNLPSVVMPDNGDAMDRGRMRELGYRYTILSQHRDRDHVTRWYWAKPQVWGIVKSRIEAKGFTFITAEETI